MKISTLKVTFYLSIVSLLPRDLYGLFIINDDLFFNVPGYNFRLYPGWTNTQRMTFSVPSIIPTFSGSFGGKMDNTDATSLRVNKHVGF